MSKKWKLIIIFGIIAVVSIFVDRVFHGRSICLFYNTYGVACPSCGMTRSYIALLHGNIHKAFYFHPLFWAVPLLLLFYILSKKKLFFATAFLFIIVWAIRFYMYFPVREPFNFNENALFPKLYRMITNN